MTWRRMDLHIHTPVSSVDYGQPNVTHLQILQRAEERGLDIIAITDHNTVAGIAAIRTRIQELELLERLKRLHGSEKHELDEYRRLGRKLLILPGFEFTATLGFHILGIFPLETSVRELEHILLNLRVPPDKLDLGSSEVGATVDELTAYRIIAEAGGLVVAAHANSTHGVAMRGYNFGGQTKIAYTQDPHLHALEVTDLETKNRRRTALFFNGSKPEYPRRMHCIQGSDAHNINRDPKDKKRLGVGDRVTEVLLTEASFEALLQVFQGDDFARTRPFRPTQAPFDHVQAAREQGPSIVGYLPYLFGVLLQIAKIGRILDINCRGIIPDLLFQIFYVSETHIRVVICLEDLNTHRLDIGLEHFKPIWVHYGGHNHLESSIEPACHTNRLPKGGRPVEY